MAYFHGVFTLPHDANPLVLANRRPLLSLLFQAASETLLTFGRNELGGTLGFVVVLHTWDQLLRDHFHLHCLVSGGALATEPDRWLPSPPGFLFRVEPLARVFRGKFLDGLKALFAQGKLAFPPLIASLGTPAGFRRLVDALYDTDWVVYCKPPFSGPEKVLDYLARYTHRVAISNHRVRDVGDGYVSFTYRDRAHGDVLRTARLPAHEFLRWFLLHVLPDGFQRIRHYGFLSNRAKKDALSRCRALLGVTSSLSPTTAQDSPRETILALTGVDIHRCPVCGGPTLRRVAVLPPMRSAPIRAPPATRQTPPMRCHPPPGAAQRLQGRSGIQARNAVETPPKGVLVRSIFRNSSRSIGPGEAMTLPPRAVSRLHVPAPAPQTTDTNPIEGQRPASSGVGQAASFNRLYPECRPSPPRT